MDFETEEQQIEALKKWWKENVRTIVAGVIIGVIVIGGWRFYVDYQRVHAEYASILYEKILVTGNKAEEMDQQQTDVNRLLAEYTNTPYASLAALLMAKYQFANGELAKAQENLAWVMENSGQPELQFLARLRMARLFVAIDKHSEALQLINVDYPENFTVMFEELKGDIYVMTKDFNNARAAYDKAILASSEQPSRWLRLKREDLGDAQVNEPAA